MIAIDLTGFLPSAKLDSDNMGDRVRKSKIILDPGRLLAKCQLTRHLVLRNIPIAYGFWASGFAVIFCDVTPVNNVTPGSHGGAAVISLFVFRAGFEICESLLV